MEGSDVREALAAFLAVEAHERGDFIDGPINWQLHYDTKEIIRMAFEVGLTQTQMRLCKTTVELGVAIKNKLRAGGR